MSNYFECNLSHDVSFLDPSVREDHLLVVESIETPSGGSSNL